MKLIIASLLVCGVVLDLNLNHGAVCFAARELIASTAHNIAASTGTLMPNVGT